MLLSSPTPLLVPQPLLLLTPALPPLPLPLQLTALCTASAAMPGALLAGASDSRA